MRVDLEHVRKLYEERMKINKLNFEDIEWYENGERVEVSPKIIKDFKFTGLNNTDFVTMNIFQGFEDTTL